MRVFQPGSQLSFNFKAPDKIGVIGQLRQNCLDRHLTPDLGMVGAIDDAKAAHPDPLADLVAADRRITARRYTRLELTRTNAFVELGGLG